ncbi:MAG: ribosome assembly cofactor RimP [Bacteroidales bacterium]|jgi:ribosome maturation factor RimP|nr:ribosome assembly cofactor RimP [Bacteroidales bacterium]
MITKETVDRLTEQVLSETQFIVDTKISNKNEIFVFIDDMNGLTIEECKRISRFIESQLDRENEDFLLEVSSPGLTNPFKVKKQYIKNIGKEIEIVLTDGEKISGKLTDVNDSNIIVETTEIKKIENKKQEVKEQQKIDFTNIKTAKNIISFK